MAVSQPLHLTCESDPHGRIVDLLTSTSVTASLPSTLSTEAVHLPPIIATPSAECTCKCTSLEATIESKNRLIAQLQSRATNRRLHLVRQQVVIAQLKQRIESLRGSLPAPPLCPLPPTTAIGRGQGPV